MTGISPTRQALRMALALAGMLLPVAAAAAQEPVDDGAGPTSAMNGHEAQVEFLPARFSQAPRSGERAIGGSRARRVGFGAGYDRECGSDRVREIQRRLRGLGYRLGPVDGLFGPRTRNAVRLLQYTLGVRPSGVVSPRTLAMLRERSPLRVRTVRVGTGRAGACGSAGVRRVQRRLRTLGYRPGPVDGRFGPLTRQAVVRFQRDHGLEPDGSIAPVTILAVLRPDRSRQRGELSRVRQPDAPSIGEPAASAPPSVSVQSMAHRNDLAAMLTGAAVALLAVNALLLLLARRRPARDGHPQVTVAAAGGLHREPRLEAETNLEVEEQRSHHRADAPGKELAPGTPVFGYASVRERDRQVDPDAFAGQANEIRAYCSARRLKLIRIVQDVEPEHGRSLARPGLRYVLDQIALGAASGLVVTDLRRLSDSSVGLAPLLRWFKEWEAALVALDLDLETTTPAGDHMARALAQVSEWDRERLSERTRRGLEVARAQGRTGHRPSVNDLPELSERIQTLRAQGMTLQAIADVLNREGVPTVRGGKQWRPSSVQTAVGYRRPIGGVRPSGVPPTGRFGREPPK